MSAGRDTITRSRRYYIARGITVTGAQAHLARSRGYSRLEDAYHDMGEGVVFDDLGEIVIFHEKHLRMLAARDSLALRIA